jgi:DNA polymerase III epsilon subunit-like protein
MRDLCFIDIETTGSLFGHHEIIEIAAIRTSPDAGHILGEWHRRIMPRHPERISPTAQKVTGFRVDNWGSAVDSDFELWSDFSSFVKGCTPVCHNPSFERAFITLAAVSSGVSDLGVDYHWIGTESLAWPLFVRGRLAKLSLSSICEHFKIEPEPLPHTARNGARACRRVYMQLVDAISYA